MQKKDKNSLAVVFLITSSEYKVKSQGIHSDLFKTKL